MTCYFSPWKFEFKSSYKQALKMTVLLLVLDKMMLPHSTLPLSLTVTVRPGHISWNSHQRTNQGDWDRLQESPKSYLISSKSDMGETQGTIHPESNSSPNCEPVKTNKLCVSKEWWGRQRMDRPRVGRQRIESTPSLQKGEIVKKKRVKGPCSKT